MKLTNMICVFFLVTAELRGYIYGSNIDTGPDVYSDRGLVAVLIIHKAIESPALWSSKAYSSSGHTFRGDSEEIRSVQALGAAFK